ncbi:uncharacterized protein Z520_04192 [Fonsecaea multimorphosa CBS 102226]|uniref:Thiolase-like protein type 1 additional C-terminal domain-containing protein n=1 Tax=Fonsecaea multimorphosa CBS 102226 TaxID=1442371 RepID=A0A0D2IU39_9EURO|nr:uncharacterized protein Z520_04192 [Fonsecaea multimorphosa CBS 102226]KIY00507.1 hypothetical protein Z520_04192 [Fonsecaea multimorphosa CBS 102226]OAL27024.1 hypothetical protein AYO22_03968 [Fonsecaea multimorphosa]
MSPQIPIVVGVGDFVNRSTSVADAQEPLTLILNAINIALEDTGLPQDKKQQFQAAIDSIDVVRTWTWPYDDLPGDIGRALGVNARHQFYSDHGGNKPAKLFDQAARRISKGQTKVAVVTGGEALASLTACATAKKLPPPGWTKTKERVDKAFTPTGRDLGKDIGAVHSIGAPIHVYPLFENAFRAHRGQSIPENHDESSQLYAEFAKVAENQPYAWNYGKPAATKEVIGTVTKRNRMICFPYPLLMNAFNTINLAGACILTSTDYAEELGIPKTKWIYVLGGAGTQDSSNFWERPNYFTSPSIERSIDAGLHVSGLTKEDIDLFDFYSCFPIVPKIAASHLNLPITHGSKPITLLGGLTSFGGAGNNYSMHALTEMTRQLRKGKGRHGLILANGGVMTYQHVICLSTTRRRGGSPYPDRDPLPEFVTDIPVPKVDGKVEGEQDAVIETYTVEFKRDNTPLRAYVVGRLKSSDHRFIANHADEETLKQLSSGRDEKIGRTGRVRNDGQRNLFTLKKGPSGKL